MDIKKLRTALNLTQSQFAKLFGTHEMTVSKWERGILYPSMYQLYFMRLFGKAAKKRQVKISTNAILWNEGIAPTFLFLLKNSGCKNCDD